MTKREGAIISAYTGILIGNFSAFHEYSEKLLGRPVYTHEFSRESIFKDLKSLSEKDFMDLNKNIKE